MSIANPKLITIEEYAELPENGRPTELVRGRVVEMNLPKPRHGKVCAEISRIVGNYAKEHDVGHVTTNDAGIITARDPDSLRGADVAFYSYSRIPKGPFPPGYLNVVPEIVFEVLSDDDRWPKVLGKVAEYLDAGASFVCVFDPSTNTARLFDTEGRDVVHNAEDELTFPSVLSDFRVRVEQFFE